MPDDEWPEDEVSAVGTRTPLEAIESRTKRTLASTLHGRTEMAELRDEMRGDFKDVRSQIQTLGAHVGDLREGFGQVNGTLEILVGTITQQNAAHLHHQTVTMTAKVDVERAEAIAEIDDAAHAKKFRRDLIVKVVAVVGSIAAGLATLLTLAISRC